ncbi:hypothetical protein [Longirhabdus pacifica]|uniref:hypothetical protein n=1 Tax=Longirhabdus pacifica TaxID=2305227 RepID=UPI001008DD87|nr:hypothetical protein [Longirhabdus pacifica]
MDKITKVSKVNVEKAKHFLQYEGRPLDYALYCYAFEHGSREEVKKALQHFQNEDGGFGNAIEPDMRCKASSAIGTAIGLRFLYLIEADSQDEMVQSAVHYLLRTFVKEKNGWQIVPKEVNNAPRAVWWNYSEDWPWGNPTMEIIGLLRHYHTLVPQEFLQHLTTSALSYITELEHFDHHETMSIMRMIPFLTDQQYDKIASNINKMLLSIVETDQNKWNTYGLQPLYVIPHPSCKQYELFAKVIPDNLDHLIAQQTSHGNWEGNWSWGQFEEEEQMAKKEWSSFLTYDYLVMLRNYDRLEN